MNIDCLERFASNRPKPAYYLLLMAFVLFGYLAPTSRVLAQSWPSEVERQLRDVVNDPIYILARMDFGESKGGLIRILQSGFERTLNPRPGQIAYQRRIFEAIYGKRKWATSGDLRLTIFDDKPGSGKFLQGATISGRNVGMSLAVLREARDWAIQSRAGNRDSFLRRQKEFLDLYDQVKRDRNKYAGMKITNVLTQEQLRFRALSKTVNHSFVVVVNFLLAHEAAHAYLGHRANSCAQILQIEQEADGYALIHHTNLMRNMFRQPGAGAGLLGIDTLTGAGARFATTHRIGNTAPACGYLSRDARHAEMMRIQSQIVKHMR